MDEWGIHYYTGILPAPIIANVLTDITIRCFRDKLSERRCTIEIFRVLIQTYRDMEKLERILLARVPTDGKTH